MLWNLTKIEDSLKLMGITGGDRMSYKDTLLSPLKIGNRTARNRFFYTGDGV